MIIEPDFFEHWKTKALVELTKRADSPLWLMRLWAHCQTRKLWGFRNVTPLTIKSICGANRITPDAWRNALLETGFLKVVGFRTAVNDWEKHNAQLLARWIGMRKMPPGFIEGTSHSQGNLKAAERRPIDVRELIEWIDKKGGPYALNVPLSPTLQEIVDHALHEGIPESEARLFHATYQANGWVQRAGIPVKDWKEQLKKWMLKAARFAKKNATGGDAQELPFDPNMPHAHTGGLPVFEPPPDESQEARQ